VSLNAFPQTLAFLLAPIWLPLIPVVIVDILLLSPSFDFPILRWIGRLLSELYKELAGQRSKQDGE
jgi:hypothetical protein